MKKYFMCLFTLLLVGNLFAQTLIDITVTSNTFTPANIIIDVGDTVRWTNVYGYHNINGTMATYPLNPESFGNAVAGTGWVYTHVFTMDGFYDYRCDPHFTYNMIGSITVSTPTSISNIEMDLAETKVYPNPTNNILNIEFDNTLFEKYNNMDFVFYDNLGKEILKFENVFESIIRIDTEKFSEGMYHYQLINNDKVIETNKIIIN